MFSIQLIGHKKQIRPGKIVCLGRNYAEHIKELNNDVPDKPVIFIKPSTSILADGGTISIPSYSNDCHHEVELAILIGTTGKNITEEAAMSHVCGYAVAIDLTLRDTQTQQKAKGLPWEIAKGFDSACPLSDFVPATLVPDPHNLAITLSVNGQMRQNGNTGLMMRKIPQIIAEISEIFTLEEGDILLTGTPAGVGPIISGDEVLARIDQVGELTVRVG
jgi:5-carboxymethyl-2-hydroxymuconate isomerase